MSERRRLELIRALEKARGSRVITYFLSDRPGSQAQIAEDAVRPMFEHLREIGPNERIDLFLYSVGGHTEVPWRIVTMIREYASEFDVLIPYKALSAATMIALGADEIVMGRKGELGPIDPALGIQRGEGQSAVQEEVRVEDIMSYVQFIKEKAGISDQAALAGPFASLSDKLEPWILGQINRAHSHIRMVARKLLTARRAQPVLDEQKIHVIVETLAEKTYQHGHAIGRYEAEEIGLNVVKAPDDVDDLMWELFECYESLARLREPLDPHTFVPPDVLERVEPVIMGCIESTDRAHHYQAEFKGRNQRAIPPQLALNINLSLQLPAGIDPAQLPAAAQQVLQQMMQQLQQQAQAAIVQEIQNQMPVTGFQGLIQRNGWQRVDSWPSANAAP